MKLERQVVEMSLIRWRHRLDSTSVKACPRLTRVDNAVLTAAKLLTQHRLPCTRHATTLDISYSTSSSVACCGGFAVVFTVCSVHQWLLASMWLKSQASLNNMYHDYYSGTFAFRLLSQTCIETWCALCNTVSGVPPLWSAQIAHSDMHHPVCGINSRILSVSLASHVSTHLLIHLSAHLYYHPHSLYPSLLHSFTPGSKPTFSTNPSHLRFLLPTRLLS